MKVRNNNKVKPKNNRVKRRQLILLQKEAIRKMVAQGYREIPIYKFRAFLKANMKAMDELYFDKLLQNKSISKEKLKLTQKVKLHEFEIIISEN